MKEYINYSIRDYEGIKIVELNGNLTSNTINDFEYVTKRLAEKESIMLNMENVEYITSAGLTSLIDVSFFAKENTRRIIILWPSEDLLLMAETLDVYMHLIFAQSLEEGQTKIKFFT